MQELKMRIKQLRIMLNLSMAEFSNKIGVSAGNVGDWESLKRSSVPSASALKSIAETFDVSLDWLLFGHNKSNKYYSETVIAKYTANIEIYEELITIALRLDEEKLAQLVEEAKKLEQAIAYIRHNKKSI